MESAPLGRRFAAIFIDGLVAGLSVSLLSGRPYAGEDAAPALWTLGALVLEVGLLVGLLGYSIGKRVMGLRVVNPDGRPIGVGWGLLRTALVCLVIPPFVQNPEGRGLHDVLSGSREVRVRAAG